MAITATMVKDLREQTGLPMMECKKALTEANGDMEGAIAWLKQNASAKMSKMQSRETSQGRVAVYVTEDQQKAGMIAMLCETAPVADTDDFIRLCGLLAQAAADGATAENILDQPSPDGSGQTLAAVKEDVFSRMRENMQVQAAASVTGHVAHYVHHNSQVGVLVEFSADCPAEIRADICMHIAALNPPYLKREDVPADQVAEAREQAAREAEGKPANIIDKIVEGKLDRWYSECVLLEQPFVKDDKQSVTQALSAAVANLTIKQFHRFQIGAA
jgi:elongation factor Ts